MNIERTILNNISIVSLILWIAIILLWSCKFIDLKFTITTIWAISAFWYWYKKYERDKELQIIDKYTKKYNEIQKYVYNRLMDDEFEVKLWKVDFIKIMNLWYEEFFLYKQWYISKKLWKEWRKWIKEDVYLFMSKSYSRYEKLSHLEKKENDYLQSVIQWAEFITSIWYFKRHSKHNKELISSKFIEMLVWYIKDYIKETKPKSDLEKNWNKITKITLKELKK